MYGILQDILEIAYDLVGKEVHVNWPVLRKALVEELWTVDKKFTFEIHVSVIYRWELGRIISYQA